MNQLVRWTKMNQLVRWTKMSLLCSMTTGERPAIYKLGVYPLKRVSITLTNDLEAAMEAYLRSQETTPSLTAVVQTALRQFLIRRRYLRARPTVLTNGKVRREGVA